MIAKAMRKLQRSSQVRASFGMCLAAASFGVSLSAHALSTSTLPKGVWNTEFRYGTMSGLQDVWGADGKLYNMGDLHSVSFDAATLEKVNPKAQTLIRALNYFGTQGLGSKINLGTLNVSAAPEITYMAPVVAYGITDHWTIGVGLPVVHYTNHMSLSSSDSNMDFYRRQFSGLSPDLDAALNVNLVHEAQAVIAAKGYRAIDDRNEEFLGDVEISALHQLSNLGSWSFMHQITLYLPTGPKDDPSDLEAVDQFGRLQIENVLVAEHEIIPNLAFLPYVGLLVPLPDTVSRRVPLNEDDVLPDQDQTQNVGRWLGPTFTTGAQLQLTLFNDWQVMTGGEGSWKAADRYTGSGRMDLLAENTDQFLGRVMGGLNYSTVNSYRQGRTKLPLRISGSISDTVMGRNFNREMITEFSASLFF